MLDSEKQKLTKHQKCRFSQSSNGIYQSIKIEITAKYLFLLFMAVFPMFLTEGWGGGGV